MEEFSLHINLALENPRSLQINCTRAATAERICIDVCKALNIGTLARHLFALRLTNTSIYLAPSSTFDNELRALQVVPTVDFRMRYKVASIAKLKEQDPNAYDYYYFQARAEVLQCKVPGLGYEKCRKELLGLSITDMLRVMLESGTARQIVEADYKKYVPKDILKKHHFFIKKPIHDNLVALERNLSIMPVDCSYVKAQYITEFDSIAPDYLCEIHEAFLNGVELDGPQRLIINIKVSPPHSSDPGLKYYVGSNLEKKESHKWIKMCTIEDLGFIAIRDGGSVELSRLNGIPIYLSFKSTQLMLSFVSLLDGYYRLSCKWTFNLCQKLKTESLTNLYSMKCHGPVGGPFSYAKLESKASNEVGYYIIRESETSYTEYYIDLCVENNPKPKTLKMYRYDTGFALENDLKTFKTVQSLIQEYSNSEQEIYFKECVPPSDYDVSQLLLCRKEDVIGDALADSSDLLQSSTSPVCISCKDLQVFKDRKETGPWCYTMNSDLIDETCAVPLCSYSQCRITGPGVEYGGTHDKGVSDRKCLKWDKERKKVFLRGNYTKSRRFPAKQFPEHSLSKAKMYCRNPDGDLGGPWCFVKNEEQGFVEREYCDIPFCYDLECSGFAKNHDIYMHYIDFNGSALTDIKFGLKLWSSDSVNEASARLVLTVLALPLTGQEIGDLGIGIEIFISNKESALRFGNKDRPEYEPTPGILTSTNFTTFTLSWDRGFITFGVEGRVKPIFLAEMKTKRTLMGHHKDQFDFYAVQGTDVLWNFPFCLDDDECDVHTTTGAGFQQFWPLRQKDIVNDLYVHVRAFVNAAILITPSPTVDFPYFKIVFVGPHGHTRMTVREYPGAAELVLKELQLDDVVDYWDWHEFSISFFANSLQIYMKKPIGMHSLLEASNEVFRVMRWFSVSSENSVAHWSFFCQPPHFAQPPMAVLPECAINTNEPDYSGTQAVTSSGLPCLPWSGKKMLPDDVTAMFKNESLILSSKNYCRDPESRGEGTFCYALSYSPAKKVERQFCHLRKCKSQQCKMAGTGNDFIGHVSTTRSGRTCDNWDVSSQSVHPEYMYTFNSSYFADMDPSMASNFCRNPNRDVSGSWCYTKDPQVVQDVCAVKDCDRPEELIVVVSTNQNGRRLYILPQWKEEGLSGGLRFSLKEWNPDLLSGVVFAIYPREGNDELVLIVGAAMNEKVELYLDGAMVESKTYPHLISAGVWTDFWLQIRRGEVMLGFKGVPMPLFEWRHPDMAQAFDPVFLAYHSVFNDMPIGLFFQKDECHTENTTDNNFLKVLPVGLYSEAENEAHTNLSLKMRGVGQIWISLMWVTNNLNSYQIQIDSVRDQWQDGSRNLTNVYKGMWRPKKGQKMEVALKFLKPEQEGAYLQEYINVIGQWAFLNSSALVRYFGVCFAFNSVAPVMEYLKYGPLDQYLRENKAQLKTYDLIEASSCLASAIWHLNDNDIVHGRVRCRKLMVHKHEENHFTVKLSDGGVFTSFDSKEIHWIAPECYMDLLDQSTESDMWAMATTLFEIFTWGEPIPLPAKLSQIMKCYRHGKRLHKPADCPEEIYSIMTECWNADPHMRKKPQEVSRDINQLLYQVFSDRHERPYNVLTRPKGASSQTIGTDFSTDDSTCELIPTVPEPDESSCSTVDNISVSSQQPLFDPVESESERYSAEDPDSETDSTEGVGRYWPECPKPAVEKSKHSVADMQSIFDLGGTHSVTLTSRLGQGYYGEVFKGFVENTDDIREPITQVAVKKLKAFAKASFTADFEREINIMQTLKHPNIVQILGVVQEPDLQLVMEYVAHGSLQSYLNFNKDKLVPGQLLKFAYDIALGMHYLGDKHIVHRDLAARNILVVDDTTVKISDFGLAQVLDDSSDYYILRSYNRNLPVKWYAPESLTDGKFSTRSDVWSYGVTLYEMFLYGKDPPILGGTIEKDIPLPVSIMTALNNGERYPCPESCPPPIYVNLMRPCWEMDPHSRPTFRQLLELIIKQMHSG